MSKKIINEQVDAIKIIDFDMSTIGRLQDRVKTLADEFGEDAVIGVDKLNFRIHVIIQRDETDEEEHARLKQQFWIIARNFTDARCEKERFIKEHGDIDFEWTKK